MAKGSAIGMTSQGPAAGGWNTWDAEWPGSVVHLPTGAVLRIGAYSASANRFTDFPWSPEYRLGTHHVDGGEIAIDLRHAGSTVRLRLTAAGDDCVVGKLTCADMAEWGLRFWLLLEFGGPAFGDTAFGDTAFGDAGQTATRLIPAPGGQYVRPPVALLEQAGGGPAAAFGPLDRPVDARLTMESGTLGRLMEEQGYYVRPAGPDRGGFAVFRFTAAEPTVTFAAAAGPDASTAQDRLHKVLADLSAERGAGISAGAGRSRSPEGLSLPAAPQVAAVSAAGPHPASPASTAIRDVLGWNSVFDPVNHRVYTACTRAWIARKFGGFGVWQIDGFLHAILAAHIGAGPLAWDNVAAVLAGRTEQGNLAALSAGTTFWADRSHPPVGAHACWSVQTMTPHAAAAGQAARVLSEAFDWWFAARDGNGNGLLEYGSSPVGNGHFVHTRQAAMDESANDNSPVYDEARFDLSTHTLDVEDIGLNSLLVHEGTMLARLLTSHGEPAAAERAGARAAELADAVRGQLWDSRREVFAGRLWSGEFTPSLSPTSFYPLLAGIATREQADAMVHGWLLDPRRFGGAYPVAGTPHEDPASADNVYWRGRVWPCFNYLVYLGLRRYRFDAEAAWLAERGLQLFNRSWAERRSYENFSQRTGDGGDSPDADPFYTWGVLLPMVADLEVISTDPWDGTCFGCAGTDSRTATAYTGGRRFGVRLDPGSTSLSRDGVALLTAGLRGRFRHLEADGPRLTVELPAASEFTVDQTLAGPDARITLNGTQLPATRIGAPRAAAGQEWVSLAIPRSERPQLLEITRA
jgi:Mannosylglycerate hydrolase MGH1-like glycoside hydrolase domain